MFRDDADRRYPDSALLSSTYLGGYSGSELLLLARLRSHQDDQARETRRKIHQLMDSRMKARVAQVREQRALNLAFYFATPS